MSYDFAQKIFSNPQLYRDQLIAANLIEGDRAKLSGKTFICVSLTRFCPVGCKFCFFKSGPAFRKLTREDILTPDGMEKFIDFCNNINLGYLLVSGGGEPMMQKQSVLEILEKVESERIVLVTSAHWAKKMVSAENYLKDIREALSKRQSPTSVTIRVSVDLEHAKTLGLEPIINLIQLFTGEYKNTPQLNLQIHSLDGDPAISDLIEHCKTDYNITRRLVDETRISDGKSVVKVVPKQEIIAFDDLEIKVGYAKAFYSNLLVDINDPVAIRKNVEVYQKDLFESEDGNSAIVTNKLGNPGLDFWVNYNGNITTWGNQFLDNLFNLYVDSCDDIVEGSLKDPAALSFIEKGANYRDRIVTEVNETTVLRSKAVNIRDYTGALMFDEARTRLYYTIRVLQDYIAEGRIQDSKLEKLPAELKRILSTDKQALIHAYNHTKHTIIQQVINFGFDRHRVLDILQWIKLGHYKVSNDEVKRLVGFYNSNVSVMEQICEDGKLPHDLKMQTVRMTEHLTHIKPEALEVKTLTAA